MGSRWTHDAAQGSRRRNLTASLCCHHGPPQLRIAGVTLWGQVREEGEGEAGGQESFVGEPIRNRSSSNKEGSRATRISEGAFGHVIFSSNEDGPCEPWTTRPYIQSPDSRSLGRDGHLQAASGTSARLLVP